MKNNYEWDFACKILLISAVCYILYIGFYENTHTPENIYSAPDRLASMAYYPYYTAVHYTGKTALWNPFIFGGMPSAAAFGDVPQIAPAFLISLMYNGKLFWIIPITVNDFLTLYVLIKFMGNLLMHGILLLGLWRGDKDGSWEKKRLNEEKWEKKHPLSKRTEKIINYSYIGIVIFFSVAIIRDLP